MSNSISSHSSFSFIYTYGQMIKPVVGSNRFYNRPVVRIAWWDFYSRCEPCRMRHWDERGWSMDKDWGWMIRPANEGQVWMNRQSSMDQGWFGGGIWSRIGGRFFPVLKRKIRPKGSLYSQGKKQMNKKFFFQQFIRYSLSCVTFFQVRNEIEFAGFPWR